MIVYGVMLYILMGVIYVVGVFKLFDGEIVCIGFVFGLKVFGYCYLFGFFE